MQNDKDNSKMLKNIKNGGSMAIYIGTASIVKPIVKEHSEECSGLSKLCRVFTGTVVSLGVAGLASKWWTKLVDDVTDFWNDVKYPKPKEVTRDAGSGNSK